MTDAIQQEGRDYRGKEKTPREHWLDGFCCALLLMAGEIDLLAPPTDHWLPVGPWLEPVGPSPGGLPEKETDAAREVEAAPSTGTVRGYGTAREG
jgi:hypothetical protein